MFEGKLFIVSSYRPYYTQDQAMTSFVNLLIRSFNNNMDSNIDPFTTYHDFVVF